MDDVATQPGYPSTLLPYNGSVDPLPNVSLELIVPQWEPRPSSRSPKEIDQKQHSRNQQRQDEAERVKRAPDIIDTWTERLKSDPYLIRDVARTSRSNPGACCMTTSTTVEPRCTRHQ